MTLWSLFWLFFYIGLFTIGGGQVAITLMYQALVDKGIIDAELFYNMLAVSESTPGPIGINMATYLGTEMFGVWGGIITTLGTVAPSVIVILIIAPYTGYTCGKEFFCRFAPRCCRFGICCRMECIPHCGINAAAR